MKTLRQHKYYLLGTAALLLWLVPYFAYANSDLTTFLSNALFTLVVSITGIALWLGGLILDTGINYFVIGFGNLFNGTVGVAVNSVWYTIRDFMNLFFIFGLVYIGFKMILNSDDSNTRRWLVNLILAALLVNFSLFITKFAVDVSNQLATEIAVNGFLKDDSVSPGSDTIAPYQVNMAGDIMNRLGISKAWDWQSGQNQSNDGQPYSIAYIVANGVMFLVAAFVFAAGGLLLMIRFVVLCLFMIISPLMFIGWILPPLGDTVSKYWKMFLSRAFFAPIYFLFLYFSLRILDTMRQSSLLKGGDAGKQTTSISANYGSDVANASGATDATLVPFFIVACVFMIASLVAANKLGADGAGHAVSMGKKTSQWAGRSLKKGAGTMSFGTAGMVGRNTVGRAAYAYSNSDKAKERASRSAFGRAMLRGSQSVAGKSFDARQVGGLGKSAGIGTGKKGGYSKAEKDRQKKRDKLEKDIGTTDTNTPENRVRVEDETTQLLAVRQKEKAAKEQEKEQVIAVNATVKEGEDAIKSELTAKQNQLRTNDAQIKSYGNQLRDSNLSNEQKTSIEEKQKKAIEQQKILVAEENRLRESLGVARERDGLSKELGKTITAEKEAAKNNDYDTLKALRNKRENLEKSIESIDKDLEKNVRVLDKELEDINTSLRQDDKGNYVNLAKEANARIKYEKQIAYMESLEKGVNWRRGAALAGSTAAIAAGTIVAGPAVGAIAGGVAASKLAARVGERQRDVADFKKKYGSGKALLKTDKKAGDKQALDKLSKAMKDNSDSDDSDDSSKKDSSDSNSDNK